MAAISVFATVEVAEDSLNDVVGELAAHRQRCLSTEPGTLLFEIMVPRDEPNRVYLYEVYASQDAFEAHWNGSSIARLRETTGDKWRITSGIWGVPVGREA